MMLRSIDHVFKMHGTSSSPPPLHPQNTPTQKHDKTHGGDTAGHQKQPRMTSLGGLLKCHVYALSCLLFSDDMHFLETRKTHLLSNMAIFGVPNLNFRDIYRVSCTNPSWLSEKMSAKGHFLLIFNLIVVVLSIVLSTLILLLSRFNLGRRCSKRWGAQGLCRPLQGWIKGRGSNAPWNEGKKTNKKKLKSVWDAFKKTHAPCSSPQNKTCSRAK